MKREAVTASRGVYVVFLDGDCNPDGPAEERLESLTAPLRSRTATAVGGITLYDGDTPLSLASSLIDLGSSPTASATFSAATRPTTSRS